MQPYRVVTLDFLKRLEFTKIFFSNMLFTQYNVLLPPEVNLFAFGSPQRHLLRLRNVPLSEHATSTFVFSSM